MRRPAHNDYRTQAWCHALLAVALNVFAGNPAVANPVPDEVEPEIYRSGALEITDPWASAAIGEAHRVKVFFEFRNHGPRADRLLAARTPISKSHAEFKMVTKVNSRAALETVPAIDIPGGGESFELSQHGFYIEISDIELPMTMGKRFALELEFAVAGRLLIEVSSRFHSPKLTRRIRAAARAGDTAELRRLRD